jgi:benzoyl-CoA reductase/2-hydroxyglutaryl-CoA dehydratase subunit BcrC/BadD/HgdB
MQTKLASSRKQLQVARRVWPIAKDYYAKARQAKREGTPVAWTIKWPPHEIIHAAGIIPVMTEHFSALLATKQLVAPYLDRSDEIGYPRAACSFHRAMIGYALSDEDLMIPPPDLFIVANFCDSGRKGFLPVIEHYQVPHYLLDLPLYYGERNSEEARIAVAYLKSQFEDLLKWIEGFTHTPVVEDRVRESIELARQAITLWGEISRLRTRIPCPMGVVDEAGTMYPLMQLLGTKTAVGFYQLLLQEVRARTEAGVGVIGQERHRLLWLGPIINYDTSLLNYFEESGVVVVKSDSDLLYTYGMDPDRPLESLAEKNVYDNYFSILSVRLGKTRRLIQDYKVDGVVMYSHLGCRHYCGGQRAVRDMIAQEFGLPILEISGDLSDFRGYDSQQVRDQVDRFIERLE